MKLKVQPSAATLKVRGQTCTQENSPPLPIAPRGAGGCKHSGSDGGGEEGCCGKGGGCQSGGRLGGGDEGGGGEGGGVRAAAKTKTKTQHTKARDTRTDSQSGRAWTWRS